ncbi:hypothetical protein OMAG_002101 [Candidatus Omnitrophus magneticus]|uniref:Uncharacterized protein n=1 Tax=Candidatus Omnitrophus magneticus TaxID=1609969 RepID=A0A0F0CR87_9BACT|nr:hypothetical protein OMAG_002101 [Candidatus Omnitrophus magneticus]
MVINISISSLACYYSISCSIMRACCIYSTINIYCYLCFSPIICFVFCTSGIRI